MLTSSMVLRYFYTCGVKLRKALLGLLGLWLLVILNLSGKNYSNVETKAVLKTLLASSLTEGSLAVLNFAVRKTAHIIEYGVLAMLLFWCFAIGQKALRTSWFLYTLLICTLVAILDEYLQSRAIERTATLRDILLDVTSAALFLALIKVMFQTESRL
ncbi:MAG: VanZ family protein [Acidobacteriota bacterium]|nr:VanZ family protein [Blastocatellia bacterium]MDW8413517.1 VanZ family protein [Acidobacteriota bacterium]